MPVLQAYHLCGSFFNPTKFLPHSTFNTQHSAFYFLSVNLGVSSAALCVLASLLHRVALLVDQEFHQVPDLPLIQQ